MSDSLSKDTKCRGDKYKYPLQVDYNKHIVGFVHKPGDGYWNGVNYIMSDGSRSDLRQDANNSNKPWQEVKINPVGAEVRRVVMYGNWEFGGVQFFDA